MRTLIVTACLQADIADMKAAYRTNQPAPLDGMWQAFVDMGDPYLVTANDSKGYAVLNGEKKLLQVELPADIDAAAAFAELVTATGATGAYAASFETPYHALAKAQQASAETNAYLYELPAGAVVEPAIFPASTTLRALKDSDLSLAVDFASETLGADRGWLKSYYSGLIDRGELFGLIDAEGSLIATGERRPSTSQQGYADVGMVVGTKARGKGVATNILGALIAMCEKEGLKPICSTEKGNLAAQKAITNAGFTSHHQITDFTF
jgi:RimJ/RimL family protein N-acetyltransferase